MAGKSNQVYRALRRAAGAAFVAAAALLPLGSAHAITRTMLVENDKFTIGRYTFAPGERQAEIHPPPGTGQIVTLVTPADIEVTLDDGTGPKTESGRMEPGKVWWLSKTTLHKYANLGTVPFDIIVVTFK